MSRAEKKSKKILACPTSYMAWIRNGQKSGVCSCDTGIFIYHQKQKELLHAEIRTGLTSPFPCPAFVRVFQGLGAVIYSITLPETWHIMWIMEGPGHRAFFSFDLHLFTIRLKSVLAPTTAVIALMMLIKEAIKAMLVGRVDIYFFKVIDIFEKIRGLSVTWAPLQVWNSSTRLQSWV